MDKYAPENIVYFDFESRSPVPIDRGSYRYAVEADAVLLAYAIGLGPVQLVDRRGEALGYGDLPDDLRQAYESGKVFCAWNTGFDRCIWNYALDDSPFLAPAQVIDARAAALAHNLPDDLETASTRLGGPGKRKDGKSLIARFCGAEAVMANDDPEAWERFCLYAKQDVEELRRVFRLMLPALTGYDWSAYQANEVVNDNGAGVDLKFCREAARLASEDTARTNARLAVLTDGVITSIHQHLRIAQWAHDRLPSAEARLMMSIVYKEEAEGEDDEDLVEKVKLTIARGVVERLLDMLRAQGCDDEVLMEVLELREFGASAAPKKFQAILNGHIDGRVYGQFVFNGGGQTGRFSGKGVQLQNLTRTVLGKDAFDDYGYWEDATVALISDGCSLDELAAHGNGEVPARKLALTIRPAFVAKGTRTLIKADYAQIEARVLPWLSKSKGGEELLDSFRRADADPSEPDLYVVTAAGMTGKKPEEISREERQRGKVAILACIAENELVTTDHGLVPIEQVTRAMKVWDGIDWVNHDGVVFQGKKEVIEYDGLRATADHIVWTEGDAGELSLRTAASKVLRLKRTSPYRGAHWQLGSSGPSVHTRQQVSVHSMPLCDLRYAAHCELGEPAAWTITRVPTEVRQDASEQVSGTLDGNGVGSIVLRATTLHESEGYQLGSIRRPWNSIQFFDGSRRGRMGDRESRTSGKLRTADRSEGQQWTLRSRQSPLVDEIGELPEQVNTYDIVNAGPRHRFTVSGVLVSNCGFGGGRNALHAMAANYRLHFTDAQAQEIVDAWRLANPWAPTFWGRYVKFPDKRVTEDKRIKLLNKQTKEDKQAQEAQEDGSYGLFGAARQAIDRPYAPIAAGRVTFVYAPLRRDGTLLCILPSGRPLVYPSCRMRNYDIVDKTTKKILDTRHGLTFRRARGVVALYGGRFAENITQATAADLLREAIVRLVDEKFEVISHSHDEIVVECERRDIERTTAAMKEAMVFDRPWAAGLPLAVDMTERWFYSAKKEENVKFSITA